jgi:hypothetical protein
LLIQFDLHLRGPIRREDGAEKTGGDEEADGAAEQEAHGSAEARRRRALSPPFSASPRERQASRNAFGFLSIPNVHLTIEQ